MMNIKYKKINFLLVFGVFIIVMISNTFSLSFSEAAVSKCLAEGTLVRASGYYKVYRITSCQKEWIETAEEFMSRGYRWEDVLVYSKSTVDYYLDYTSGAELLKATNSPMVFYITESGTKRHIPTIEIFNSYGNRWEDVKEVSPESLDAYKINDLIKLEGDYKVYKLIGGVRYWINDIEIFNQLGLDWNKVAPINKTEFDYYEEGGDMISFYIESNLRKLLAKYDPNIVTSDYTWFSTVNSSYDNKIAVLFGEKQKCCEYPVGLFFMDADFENASFGLENNYKILEGDTTHLYINNVRWKSATSARFNIIVIDEGGESRLNDIDYIIQTDLISS